MKTVKTTTSWLLSLMMIAGLFAPGLSVRAQTNQQLQDRIGQTGRTVASYQVTQSGRLQSLQDQEQATRQARPEWVNLAVDRSLPQFEIRKEQLHLLDPATNLSLLSAVQDDLQRTHLRLAQMHNGIEVFGGQVLSHLQGQEVMQVSGYTFDTSNIDTTPSLTDEQAIEAAQTALGYTGQFATPPQAKLIVLPHRIFKDDAADEATLTYQVTLHIEDGTNATAQHQYFVNAQDGSIVWHYDSMSHEGLGQSLYSGVVGVPTTQVSKMFQLPYYEMADDGRGSSRVTDMGNGDQGNGAIFTSYLNVWGDGTMSNRQSAAVDAQFGVTKTWDYFSKVHNRLGMDGKGSQITSRVHYGSSFTNAFHLGGTNIITFGDGQAGSTNPWVSLDIVAHEFTHRVTETTAGLIYSHESGAINESFSDIFGTAVEWETGLHPDYLVGEDIFVASRALRSMSNPAAFGDPDHYSRRSYSGECGPDKDSNDFCGVHTNSGIMNNAFYLLAEGGTNRTSNLAVEGISRRKAELIFYRALVVYLFPWAKFTDARQATIKAAADLYGVGSREYFSTTQAWDAVGVEGFAQSAIFTDHGLGSFQPVEGALKQIETGSAMYDSVWGLNHNNDIFWYNLGNLRFEQVPGKLVQISASPDGNEIWGVNAAQDVFRFNLSSSQFEQVPGIRLSQVAVGLAGIWGLNQQDEIFRFEPSVGQFLQVPGRLMKIEVGQYSVWGLNRQQMIFRFNEGAGYFELVLGRLTKLAVSKVGHTVPLPAGDDVWGINENQDIFRYNPPNPVRRTEGQFIQIPGKLVKIDVGNGAAWGINQNQDVFRYNFQAHQFEQVPGKLTEISVNGAGRVWGLYSQPNAVSLKAYGSDYYCTAESGGGGAVNANRSEASNWERFTIENLNSKNLQSGALMDNDKIRLRSFDGHYLVAEGGGGSAVLANRQVGGGWETFTVHKVAGSFTDNIIRNGDVIALQAYNGQYLTAEGGGGGAVNANRNNVSTWEEFRVVLNN